MSSRPHGYEPLHEVYANKRFAPDYIRIDLSDAGGTWTPR